MSKRERNNVKRENRKADREKNIERSAPQAVGFEFRTREQVRVHVLRLDVVTLARDARDETLNALVGLIHR